MKMSADEADRKCKKKKKKVKVEISLFNHRTNMKRTIGMVACT